MYDDEEREEKKKDRRKHGWAIYEETFGNRNVPDTCVGESFIEDEARREANRLNQLSDGTYGYFVRRFKNLGGGA